MSKQKVTLADIYVSVQGATVEGLDTGRLGERFAHVAALCRALDARFNPDGEGGFCLSGAKIASVAGISTSQASGWLRRLVKDGWLELVQQGSQFSGLASYYRWIDRGERMAVDARSDLGRLVQRLREEPGDDASRLILADLFEDIDPIPFEAGKVPSWLRLVWLRCRPDADAWPRRHPGGNATWQAWDEFGRWIDSLSRACATVWDHPGTATIAGLECLVTEPYRPVEEIQAALAIVNREIPCLNWAFARRGTWHGGATVRGIIFPPLVMPPPKSQATKAA